MKVLQAEIITDAGLLSNVPAIANDSLAGEQPEAMQSLVDRQCRKHRQMLLISVGVLLLAAVMQVLPEGRVAFAGLQSYPLPHLCTSRLIGYSCPGCGLTRSIIHLVHGDLAAAMQVHRFGWLVGVLIAAQIPLRVLWIWKLRRSNAPLPRQIWINSLGYLVLAALIVDWIVRLAIH